MVSDFEQYNIKKIEIAEVRFMMRSELCCHPTNSYDTGRWWEHSSGKQDFTILSLCKDSWSYDYGVQSIALWHCENEP